MKEPIVKIATASAIRHLIKAQELMDVGEACQAEIHLRTAVVILQQFADMDKFTDEQRAFVKESVRLMLGSTS